MANIRFVEKTHRYLTETGEDLISVSKFTERFKEKVDWTKIAKTIATKLTKEGTLTSVQDVLSKWEKKRDISATIGTLFHEMSEAELITKGNLKCYGKDCQVEVGIQGTEDKYSIPINTLKNNTIYPELMIYDTDYMICGQSDKVIVVDGKINIWDYKTDAEISFKGFSNKWVSPKKLLAPLGHLDDCNGNIYSIKMSLYMYLLWKANKGKFKPGEIIIEHKHLKRDPDNDNIPVLENGLPVVLKTENIVLPYRKKEVMTMLKTLL